MTATLTNGSDSQTVAAAAWRENSFAGPDVFPQELGQPNPPTTAPTSKPKTRAPPELRSGDWIKDNVQPLPDELVRGLLHKGCKMVLGGGSKSFKTWCLADLAISISTGAKWWGLETVRGPVAFLNFELQEQFFHERLRRIAEAKGVELTDELQVWNLRGHSASAAEVLPELVERLKARSLAGIFIDPLYKISAGTEENSAKEVGLLMQHFEGLAVQTGAGVISGAHFSKGNQAGKEAMDRIRGSGVYARDPDAIVTLTKHSEEDAFTVESILRNCPPLPAFAVRWEFPLMVPAPDLDPADLKQVKPGKNTRPVGALAIVEKLPTTGGWKAGQWGKHCREEFGISERSFYNLLAEAKEKHGAQIHQRTDRTYVRIV